MVLVATGGGGWASGGRLVSDLLHVDGMGWCGGETVREKREIAEGRERSRGGSGWLTACKVMWPAMVASGVRGEERERR